MLEVDHQYESMITLVFRGGKTPNNPFIQHAGTVLGISGKTEYNPILYSS